MEGPTLHAEGSISEGRKEVGKITRAGSEERGGLYKTQGIEKDLKAKVERGSLGEIRGCFVGGRGGGGGSILQGSPDGGNFFWRLKAVEGFSPRKKQGGGPEDHEGQHGGANASIRPPPTQGHRPDEESDKKDRKSTTRGVGRQAKHNAGDGEGRESGP